jgi:hypothetical protein
MYICSSESCRTDNPDPSEGSFTGTVSLDWTEEVMSIDDVTCVNCDSYADYCEYCDVGMYCEDHAIVTNNSYQSPSEFSPDVNWVKEKV